MNNPLWQNIALALIHMYFLFLQVVSGTVHWDGKLLPEITGNEKVDRLPVIISHNSGEQFLGAPKISAGTGREMAAAVYEQLLDWKIQDNIVAACFDTTSSNTGRLNGAAVLLEQMLERNLLYLPCRHHICELYLRAAFESKFGSTTSGANVPLFVRFQKSWKNINKSNFKSGMTDDYIKTRLNNHVDNIRRFCTFELQQKIARDDYKELLQLALIFIGDTTNTTFRLPGPMHHARWMAKALYSLKVYIFREEFQLTAQEVTNLRDICIFIVRFYLRAWFRCTKPSEAPNCDLLFLREMSEYKRIDKKIAEGVINKIVRHLWYLADECIALSFFDENVPNEVKRNMVLQLKSFDNEENDGETESCKRVIVTSLEVESFILKPLSDFVTANTKNFFERFNIKTSFLNKDPTFWEEDADFQEARAIVNNIQVVNDNAERGVKLIEDYNKILTKKEEEKQFLLQVVIDYRRKFPAHTKKSLTNEL